MGSVYVNGEVDGDVVAVLGNVELGPEAKVRGNVVIVGGELTKDPAASIDGQVQTTLGFDWSNFDWAQPWIDKCLLYGRPLAFTDGLGWAWGIALGLLALYVFIAFLFRGAVDQCVHTLETKPGQSVLAALLTMLVIPVVFVLLLITVLGIAAIPFLAVGLLIACVFGKIVLLAFIGRRCTPMLAKDPVVHTVVGVLVGGLILLLVYTIPLIGFVVYKTLEILGLGVVMYTMLLATRAGRQGRGSPGGSGGSMNSGESVWAGQSMGSGPAGPTPSQRAGVGSTGWGNETGVGGGSASPGGVGDTGAAAGGGAFGSAGIAGGTGDFGAAGAGGVGDTGAAAGGDAFGSAGAAGPTGGIGAAGAGGVGDAGAAGGGSAFGAAGAADLGGGGPSGAAGGGLAGGPPGGSGAGGSGTGGSGPTGFGGTDDSPAALLSLPRAGFGIRMGALLLDLLIVGIVTHALHDGGHFHLVALAIYGAVMWKLKGSTIGGIICGLRVVRLDGRPIDWPTAIVRALSCFLSLVVAGLGFLWIAIDDGRQGWHDKIAGTVVVRAPKGASLL
jgi:uncharacterized RDD family membrane protein YckC